MLLGLIFLHDNKLIVDVNTKTVVDKCNEYDLMRFGSQKTLIATYMKKETKNELDTKLSELLCLVTIFTQEYIVTDKHLVKLSRLKDIELQVLNKKHCQEFIDYFEEISYIS